MQVTTRSRINVHHRLPRGWERSGPDKSVGFRRHSQRFAGKSSPTAGAPWDRPNEHAVREEIGEKRQNRVGHSLSEFSRTERCVVRIEVAVRVTTEHDGCFLAVVQDEQVANS